MLLFTKNIWLSGLVREFIEKREKSNNLQSQVEHTAFMPDSRDL